PPAADDERDDREAFAGDRAQHAEVRLFVDRSAAVQELLAPAEVPLVQRERQGVVGPRAELLVVGAQRTNALYRGDDLRGRGRERWSEACRGGVSGAGL